MAGDRRREGHQRAPCTQGRDIEGNQVINRRRIARNETGLPHVLTTAGILRGGYDGMADG